MSSDSYLDGQHGSPLLFIDIETIPGQQPWIKERVAEMVAPPANMSKPETIQKWEEEKKPEEVEKKWRDTSFDGALGEIVSIAWAVGDHDVRVVHREKLEDSEADILNTALAKMAENMESAFPRRRFTWVGHNLSGFDLRFLWQRCVVNQVRPPIRIPHDAKPWSDEICDTMLEWSGLSQRRGVCSMDDLCRVFGIPGKSGDIDGSKVWEYVRDGRIEEVADYNMADVERVRNLWKRLNFVFDEEQSQ